MTKENLESINEERLTSWAKILNKSFATPSLLIGIGHGPNMGTPVVIAPENVDRELMTAILLMGLKQMSPVVFNHAIKAFENETGNQPHFTRRFKNSKN